MKLRRLDLLRYGHLTDAALDFSPDACLHVVHGANEAGKSTALAAVTDALFGFGHRTEYDFLHGGPQLRVGFTLAASDGSQGSFVRRKGRRDTLRDAEDNAVAEDALRRFLGGITRESFERGFGLDGTRLRAGGQELLRLGGEVGESLLAGAGLMNLRAALTRLEEEARSLVGDGRGRRRLSEAVDAWRQAQRDLDERSVAPRAWQDADATHTAAVAALAELQEQIRQLSEESSRLQRIRRVAPLLAERDDTLRGLADLADAPHLPADAGTRFQALTEAQREAARDYARETEAAQRLGADKAALPQDPAVLALQDAIDALQEQRGVVLQATGDLPGVQAKAAALRSQVAAAIEELGLELAPETARDQLPAATARRAVQRLVNQHARLQAEQQAAARELAAGERARQQAAALLAEAAEPTSPALLRRTIDAVRGEGRLDAELARAESALTQADTAAANALAQLPLWQGDLAGLAACPLPLPAACDHAAAGLDTEAAALKQAQADVTALAQDIAAVEEELSRLSRGEAMPTPAAVAAARAERDRIWRILRRLHEGAPPPPGEQLPDTPLPDAFEALRDHADRLADRRADEAQRVADFLSASDRLRLLRDRQQAAEAAGATAVATLAEAEARWQALWAPTGIVPAAPPAMLEWRRDRAEVLRLGAEADAARHARDALAGRRDAAMGSLLPLLPPAAGPETLAVLLRRAETACVAAEAAVTEHAQRRKALADAEARLPALRDAVQHAAAALATWQQNWATAVQALALPTDAGIDMAEAALAAWARIAESVPAWRTEADRVAAMQDSVGRYAAEVDGVRLRLDEPASGEPAAVVVARWARRLAEARKAAADGTELGKRIAVHEIKAKDAAERRDAAEQDLAALRSLAGVTDDAALAQAIERSRRHDALVAVQERTIQALRAQGDGLPEAALRAEAAAIEPDSVVGRLAEIEAELAALGDRREELSAQRTKAEATLAEMRVGHDAAAMAQQAENALADAREAAERYARVHVARVLLRAGIDRFRKEQQGPLLRAAGAHFATLTDGRYDRLAVDYDEGGRAVLLAVRDSGMECPVEGLSEGARDQLYLALRIAAVEAHARQAEPLPFIADDLLVHFDDVRAGAAVALLAELGRSTQVILFTHHEQVVTLAERQPGVAVQRMHRASAGA